MMGQQFNTRFQKGLAMTCAGIDMGIRQRKKESLGSESQHFIPPISSISRRAQRKNPWSTFCQNLHFKATDTWSLLQKKTHSNI